MKTSSSLPGKHKECVICSKKSLDLLKDSRIKDLPLGKLVKS